MLYRFAFVRRISMSVLFSCILAAALAGCGGGGGGGGSSASSTLNGNSSAATPTPTPAVVAIQNNGNKWFGPSGLQFQTDLGPGPINFAIEFFSNGTGKMSLSSNGDVSNSIQFTPVQFNWSPVSSDTMTISIQTGPAPAAPSNVTASGIVGSLTGASTGQVTLNWTGVSTAQWYNVFQTGVTAGPGFISSNTLTVKNLAPGNYNFSVTAESNWAQSGAATIAVTIPSTGTVNSGPSSSPGQGAEGGGQPTDNSFLITQNLSQISGIDPNALVGPSQFGAVFTYVSGTVSSTLSLSSGGF